MEALGKLFGNPARVKLMRLFLFHEGKRFCFDTLRERTLVRKDVLRRELKLLKSAGFITQRKGVRILERKLKNGEVRRRKKKETFWSLNARFPLKEALRTLLLDSELIRERDFLREVKRAGKLKLLILSGLFVKDSDREVDVLIVIDRPKKRELEQVMRKLESEIGRELRYALFDSGEFQYRIDMYDKLVRDVLENEHKVLFNAGDFLW